MEFAEELLLYSACAIDVSDGLIADLGHIVSASHCGADVYLSHIPVSSASRYYFDKYNDGVIDWSMLLTRGDDYELCFTISCDNESSINAVANKHNLKISCIGEIKDSKELSFISIDGDLENFSDS